MWGKGSCPASIFELLKFETLEFRPLGNSAVGAAARLTILFAEQTCLHFVRLGAS